MVKENRASDQAKAQLDSLRELVAKLDDPDLEKDARQEIQEDPLSIEVRSDWSVVGKPLVPGEYNILLCTGGPAVRIIGELDGDPITAELEYQDWFTFWEWYDTTTEEKEDMLRYAREFYYGE